MNDKKKMSSMSIALLLFIAVFGITNIPANYSSLGNSAIGWFILLGIYFIPLAFIIGELSSHDINSKSGMFGWIRLGLSEKWAFIGAWSYFIVNIFYLPMLASRIPTLFSWVFTSKISSLSEVVNKSGELPGVITATTNHGEFLFLAFIVFLFALFLGLYFQKFFSSFAKVVGWASLIITFLFIIMGLLIVPFSSFEMANDISLKSIMPSLSPVALSTFAWIVFAISGIETVGSYTAYVGDARKTIPKGIILAAVITIVGYVLGFVSLSFILTPEQVPVNHMENMTAIMFAQIGSMYGLGTLFLRIVIFLFLIITITAVVLWLNSTVISLFEEFPKGIVPDKLADKKFRGVPIFGYLFTGLMVILFLIIANQSSAENIYYTLYDMTTIAVLVPYLLITISFISFCKQGKSNKIIKNNKLGIGIGIFIFLVTAISIIFSIFDLTYDNMQDMVLWAITSGGGLLFFISIGIGIYMIKDSFNKGFIFLIIIFTIAGILFEIIFLIIAIVLLIVLILKNKNITK